MIDDDELVAAAADAIVLHDVEARRLQEEILLQEEIIKNVVGTADWSLLLVLDEMKNERFSELLLVIARWAFSSGVRSASRPRGST